MKAHLRDVDVLQERDTEDDVEGVVGRGAKRLVGVGAYGDVRVPVIVDGQRRSKRKRQVHRMHRELPAAGMGPG